MSRRDEMQRRRRLIKNHLRRLQALEERKALYGIDTPLGILTEIQQDIEVAIEKLQVELRQLADEGQITSKKSRNCLWIWILAVIGIILLIILAVCIGLSLLSNQDILNEFTLMDVNCYEDGVSMLVFAQGQSLEGGIYKGYKYFSNGLPNGNLVGLEVVADFSVS